MEILEASNISEMCFKFSAQLQRLWGMESDRKSFLCWLLVSHFPFQLVFSFSIFSAGCYFLIFPLLKLLDLMILFSVTSLVSYFCKVVFFSYITSDVCKGKTKLDWPGRQPAVTQNWLGKAQGTWVALADTTFFRRNNIFWMNTLDFKKEFILNEYTRLLKRNNF